MAPHNKAKLNTCLAVQYHWAVWKFLGIEPPKRESKWFKVYIFYAIILNMTVLMFTASLIVNLILSKNLSELCENICNTTTDLTCNIKFFYIPFIRHKLLKVHKILERLDARADKGKEVAILEEGIRSARKLFKIFALLCFCFVMSAQVAVFFSSERIQIYPTWIPWDWKASRRNYLLTQLYIFYVTSLQSTQIVLSDTYPPAYLIILSTQIKALACRIKTLGSTGTNSDQKLCKELADCIKDHNTLLE